ncbi:cation-independent mannose-6-phosphate receptor-like isoform X2 [Branchiostoma floridae x Branchiostoma belcheri]
MAAAVHLWHRHDPKTSMFWTISSLFFVFKLVSRTQGDCVAGNYNLEPIQGLWEARGDNNVQYNISICSQLTLPAPCNGNSVCRLQSNVTSNIGNFNSSLQIDEDRHGGGFRMELYSDDDCPGHPGHKIGTSINIQCGRTLGFPEFVEAKPCTTYFDWDSTVACTSVQRPAQKEVKCYVYGVDGKKRDLTPLIRQNGGYLVDSAGERDFYINVCRDITPETGAPTSSCPPGTAGCRVIGGEAVDMGRPTTDLQMGEEGRLFLHYNGTDGDAPAGCNGVKPTVHITFVCPNGDGRGGSKDPLLTLDTDCQYQVEWWTEYACPAEYLTTTTCSFSKQQHDIDIDLSPLRVQEGTNPWPYKVTTTGDDGKTYDYWLNVCGAVGIQCGDNDPDGSHTSVCQTSADSAHIAGATGHTLRYSDGELTLTYKHGEVCRHNGFNRTSVITFRCNKTADNNGRGRPVFNGEEDCSYFFDWDTSYACLQHEEGRSCRVSSPDGKKRYDLSTLVQEGPLNWEALDGRHEHEGGDNDERFFMNVCGEVITLEQAADCPQGAAACAISDTGGGTTNIGRYQTDPVLEGNHIKLTYTDGDSCHNSLTWSTVIRLVCSPGDLESAPVLLRRSDEKCLYEFEWHTAAACPLGRKSGYDCRVFDDDAGFSFDLTPLSRAGTTADSFYNVTNGKYDYLINVCGDINGTKSCEDRNPKAGACQVDRGNNNAKSLGIFNSHLNYYDGLINLTYSGGDLYHDKVNRSTHIAFLCDPKAGPGQPQFLAEDNHFYYFKWYTKYACPEQPIECVVTDPNTHTQYDLSSLAKSEDDNGENWSYLDDSDPNNKKKYYINVCRPINPVSGCDTYAAVCQTSFANGEEAVTLPNMGMAESRPTIEGQAGHLLLTYSNGGPCTGPDGVARTYTTKIHLICQRGSLSSSPRFLEQMGCEFVFTWETEAACGIKVETQEDCTIPDPNSGYIFNLQPLTRGDRTQKKYYDVTSSDGQAFRLNICGSVKDDGCPQYCDGDGHCEDASVCSVSSGKNKALAHARDAQLEFSDAGQLTLRYYGVRDEGSGQVTSVMIHFVCRTQVALGEPKFLRQEGLAFLFEFATSLACPPAPVDCLVTDTAGNLYDLTPLSRTDRNWEPLNPESTPGHKDERYHINVCRPLVVTDNMDYSCPGGPLGSCMTGPLGNKNLGVVQSNPQAAGNSLSIRYYNGDMCRDNVHYSTVIVFECSLTQGTPTFQTTTQDGCEYAFLWRTPSACPIRRAVGNNCRVRDPLYGFEFDLSPLYNYTHDYRVRTQQYEYSLNVCGPLHEGTGMCDAKVHKDVSSCQKTLPGVEPVVAHVTGTFNKTVVYEDGQILLNYTGGEKCHTVYNRSTAINFYCDHCADGRCKDGPKPGPVYVNETSDCTYVFEWATSYACPPFKIVECVYHDKEGNQFDLTPLSLSHGNWEIIPTSRSSNNEIFYINVCRSVVHSRGVQCPYNAGACMKLPEAGDAGEKFMNLGEVQSGPWYEDGNLVLNYTLGENCTADGSRKKMTVIKFVCDADSVGNGPQFLGSTDGCIYTFIWFTDVACPLKAEQPSEGNCKAKNPLTGYEFDLSGLNKKDSYYQVLDQTKEHAYQINVCGAVKGSKCDGDDLGVCQAELIHGTRTFSGGKSNSNLDYNEGILELTYKHGARCHKDQFERSSVVSFVCANRTDNGRPVFIDESEDCTYYFSFHTPLACETQVPCIVDNGTNSFDLSPLIKAEGHFMAPSIGGTGVYYINICRPLNPIPGVRCPPGASACMKEDNKNPVSLGRVFEQPKINPVTKEITIIYKHGSRCESNPNYNNTAQIVFRCEQGTSVGSPQFSYKTDDCVYFFEWKTNVVCAAPKPVQTTECTYTDPALKYTFNLTSLRSTGDNGYEVEDNVQGGKYSLNVCGTVPRAGCDSDTAVCVTLADGKKISAGKFNTQTFKYEGNLLTLSYSDGTTCRGSEKYSTNIIFKCAEEQNSQPAIFSMTGCSYTFMWKTSLACPPASQPCAIQQNGQTYDLNLLSQETNSWRFRDKFGNKYYLNLCQPVHQGPPRCDPNAAACRQRNDGTVDNLGMVSSQTMNVDDTGLQVVYSEGGAGVCDDHARRSNSNAASIEIQFSCGSTVGGPQLHSIDSNGRCHFVVNWRSAIACATERESVTPDESGKIRDPFSQSVIPISQLYNNNGNSWRVTGDLRPNRDVYVYYIRMDDVGIQEDQCRGAAVCQVKEKDSFMKVLGKPNMINYYMQDGALEVQILSDTKCGRKQEKKTSTTIIFHCSEYIERGQPEFFSESHDCEYIFNWYTSVACLKDDVEESVSIPPPEQNLPDDGTGIPQFISRHKNSAATVVGIMLAIVIICVLVIIFHKQERRQAFVHKMKSCCGRGDYSHPTYRYTKFMSNGDEDGTLLMGGLDSDEESGNSQSEEASDDFMVEFDAESHQQNRAKRKKKTKPKSDENHTEEVRPYHDDSDEDMLDV